MNRIEDQEQYNGIRDYRNELMDKFKDAFKSKSLREWQKLCNRISELDTLLNEAERDDQNFAVRYKQSRTGHGTL